ncbi:mannose-6-phosphate isomerase, type 1 [Microbacterium sp. cf046]|uniref:mannose-6-phosphate isomerase, class I n=1 Tax=Microbacterium sp. cf046 TaxID=1761803 RepID=UPI0008E1B5E4|nr:mannose-6-phosphate isomerase, class I [Microbacterium sp. cf046]SFR99245.1 mannose-6-phosphate isomerase, type 1 [Microbacterium sp. cf046]
MLAPITNTPRDYEWGSTTLLAGLEGRTPTGAHEAEIWFGDHPGCPAVTADGRPLGAWLADEGVTAGAPAHLPFLLKLLAAASSLSIQAHPSRAQAVEAFAREERAGIPRDAPHRTYRDENHKPELIVAVSPTFTALAGIRDLDATRRLLGLLGDGGQVLIERLAGADAAAAVRGAIEWLLSGDAAAAIAAIAAAARTAQSDEFADELALIRRLAADFPGDPGLGVAVLMNLVTLRRGEGLFVPAGVLHAYQDGLGVEIMAASDNVLRGGLTPKHVDVGELVRVLDPTPGPVPVLRPEEIAGVARFAPDVPDFALLRVQVRSDAEVAVPVGAVAIALATAGAVTVRGGATGEAAGLAPGRAVLATPDEDVLTLTGSGEIFIALPGA